MLKSYLAAKGISTYKLSKKSHVPYSTLNDLANHKLTIENVKSSQLKALADALSLDMNTVYDMCHFDKTVRSKRHDLPASISIEHNTYYLNFERNGHSYKYELLPVRHDPTRYLETLAVWKLDEIPDGLEMEDAYETICSETP